MLRTHGLHDWLNLWIEGGVERRKQMVLDVVIEVAQKPLQYPAARAPTYRCHNLAHSPCFRLVLWKIGVFMLDEQQEDRGIAHGESKGREIQCSPTKPQTVK